MSPILALVVFAASPVGAWHGRMVVNAPPMPANAPAAAKAQYAKGMAQVRAARFALTVRPDHTYEVHVTGIKMPGENDTKGTWSQKGQTLSLTEKSRVQTFTLDPAGKTLTTSFGPQGKIVFVR